MNKDQVNTVIAMLKADVVNPLDFSDVADMVEALDADMGILTDDPRIRRALSELLHVRQQRDALQGRLTALLESYRVYIQATQSTQAGPTGGRLLPMMISRTSRIPTRAHDSDVGLDLCADIGADTHGMPLDFVQVRPGDRMKVCTGVSVQFPPDVFAFVMPRSGLASKGVVAEVGTIDPGYRGEICVNIHNRGHEVHRILQGDKLAQLVLLPALRMNPFPVPELSPTPRGDNGFGSSGR